MAQVVQTDEIIHLSRQKQNKWYKNWKIIVPGVLALLAVIVGAMSYYQATHFNFNRTINGINVSGLTAENALNKLKTTALNNDIYIEGQLILNGKDTEMHVTQEDLPQIKKLLKSQWTFFPSFRESNYSLMPSKQDEYRGMMLKNDLEQKLLSLNAGLTSAIDSHASLENGKIVISKSVDGKQYDVENLLKEYDQHGYTSEIHLSPLYLSAIKEDSETVKKEEKTLQALLDHTVEYKVQDKIHSIKGSDYIKNATVSKEMKVSVDPGDLKKKIAEINNTQSTLGKDFQFKTHSGSVVSVKGQGYGWALDVDKETAAIQKAFENGETSVSVSHIRGNGWNNEGYGYETTANNGIGDTYAEVSIKEQRIWIYRDGKQVFTTNVVTGKHSTGEDTSPGVWYILFKRSPYTLNGTSVGSGTYSIQVDYWAPFTNSGQGFHDASWRTNWNSNAYLTAGSGGCVNVQANVMKTVYDNLNVHDPVVVY
ncbi:L,D-transpeptidase family protein [Bacillus sp. FJAT-27251]|uniref:L,D-transpeptidase family protein n=1 Tax=Bacillus sp. FJAT-27251 TaxID=1684142 RepID=UPI000AE4CCE0|nr:L,D-transpeptidase family protein [Bacillus sp. FJAT-27251]